MEDHLSTTIQWMDVDPRVCAFVTMPYARIQPTALQVGRCEAVRTICNINKKTAVILVKCNYYDVRPAEAHTRVLSVANPNSTK